MRVLGFARFLAQNSCYSLQTCKNISSSYKQFVTYTECKMYSSNFKTFFSQTRSKFTFTDLRRKKGGSVTYSNIFVYLCHSSLRKMPVFLKDHSVNIVKLCAEQCEFIIAQRIRRSQQIFCLYMKIWNEMALKQLLSRMRRNLFRKGKHVLLGATVYNWDQERITDEEILRYCNELEVVKELRRKKFCRKDARGTCDCFTCLEPEEQEWSVFVNEEDITVWKREESNHIGQGLYCYKMYGRYEDVTALDFLEAQVDLEYRLTWDENAVRLYTIETEPSSNSDIIYWETKWPKLFSNRDYVFKRRFFIDEKRKLVTLVNKCTDHHKAPLNSNKQRVTEYWSYMVIKPFTTLDKPGIEFSLTYFDNPGISVPSTLSLWVTVQGMPVFLQHLHDAAKRLALKRQSLKEGGDSGGSGCGKPRDEDDRRSPPDHPADPSCPSNGYPPPPKDKPCPGLPKTLFKRLYASLSFF